MPYPAARDLPLGLKFWSDAAEKLEVSMTTLPAFPGVDTHSADPELDSILANRLVRSVYQPIVELDSLRVVGWEALARGPEGSPLERPDRLFAAAARAGRTAELDWHCRAAALRGALRAGLDAESTLFVNVEPATPTEGAPEWLGELADQAQQRFAVVMEVTERALTHRPAEMLTELAGYRSRGWGVALDDVEVDPRSLALMPFLRPDVIKLDMQFAHAGLTPANVGTAHAVAAEAEREGIHVLAEGIEVEAHAQVARALGATLGQGWLFGRPGAIHPSKSPGRRLRRVSPEPASTAETPFTALAPGRTTRVGSKALLLQMSLQLEDQAMLQGANAVLLSTFQDRRFFSGAARRRYERVAARVAFVGALAVGLGREPATGVRGADLAEAESLRGEWNVVVISPHFAGAFVARDLGDTGADDDRRFEYILTHDRALVTRAAQLLMTRVAPD